MVLINWLTLITTLTALGSCFWSQRRLLAACVRFRYADTLDFLKKA
jgi:hypothetical protein